MLHAISVQPMNLGDTRVDTNIAACEDGLRRLLRTREADIFMYAANGHGVWEAVIENLLAPGETVLVPATGHFSESWRTADPPHNRRMNDTHDEASEVVHFWRDAGPARWFRKDEAFDAQFRECFLALHERAAAGELDGWAAGAQGVLALLILLDQFPRNAFRGTTRMYATDAQAQRIARAALERGLDAQVPLELRNFMVLPLMHAENAADQELSVAKTAALGGEPHRFALHHRDVIRRFGRFPHRNALLGRASTEEERQFLAAGGFSG